MKQKKLKHITDMYYSEGKRLVAPLVGFPGVKLVGSSIKLSQQNSCEHLKVINSINERFHPDLLFPLMDLSVEANAVGRQTIILPNESATVVIEDFDIARLNTLKNIAVEYDSRLLAFTETVKKMKLHLPDSVMKGAYVTGPYTLAGLILGAENAAIKSILDQDELKEICEFTISVILKYVASLITSGAQLICVLEPSAVMLGPDEFELFSANYVKRICDYCDEKNIAAVYHICGNSSHLVNKMCEAGVDALSLDSKEA
ncbi:MAG: Uroporphyrinogen decarboxylase (URO-D) [Ignavibacteria bacterium]|nr:MAG: Uroporphyrinogen decarboxylase (URO-D) [Ignavibacteria bacterium]KAF0160868.1 MAG: Uroporphyrinogen decarboxylase (URO-D) [Ignavibacteria bacterium]